MYIVLSLYTTCIPLLLHPTRSGKKALELINLDTLLHQLHFFSPRLIGTVKAAWLGLCRQSGSSFYSVHFVVSRNCSCLLHLYYWSSPFNSSFIFAKIEKSTVCSKHDLRKC